MIHASGALGLLVSFGLIVLQTVLPFAPFALLAGFNAAAHGFWLGCAVTFAGAYAGALLLYWLSSRAMRALARRRLGGFLARRPRLARWLGRIRGERGWPLFLVILTLRLQPWLPSSAIDLAAGVAQVPPLPFAAATAAGQAPMVGLEAYLGHRLLNFRAHQGELWMIGLASLALLGAYFAFRSARARRRQRARAGTKPAAPP